MQKLNIVLSIRIIKFNETSHLQLLLATATKMAEPKFNPARIIKQFGITTIRMITE
jgi:hypothetical protein